MHGDPVVGTPRRKADAVVVTVMFGEEKLEVSIGHPDAPALLWYGDPEQGRAAIDAVERYRTRLGAVFRALFDHPLEPGQQLRFAAAHLPPPQSVAVDTRIAKRANKLRQPDDAIGETGRVAQVATIDVYFRRIDWRDNQPAWMFEGALWVVDAEVGFAGGMDGLGAHLAAATGAQHVQVLDREGNITHVRAYFSSPDPE